MLTVRQTRYDYPHAAKKRQRYGWALIRTDVTFGGRCEGTLTKNCFLRGDFIGIMTEPYDTAEHAVQMLGTISDATVAYVKIKRGEE